MNALDQAVERRPLLCALLTVFNRKAQTLACLERLEAQAREAAARLRVILVDDGSSDGTAAAVRQRFPGATVVQGSGQLYWNGGMRLAFEVAWREDPDLYLFLNDDTLLLPGALERMLATHRALAASGDHLGIVVGSTLDPSSGRHSYGGWRTGPWHNPGRFQRVEPGAEAQRCDTMNCNCALLPREVARRVGNLDPAFTHSMGDFDYGLRARRSGCSLWVAPGWVGECAENAGEFLRKGGARERWRRLLGPKGLPPREWLTFTSRHFGPFWLLHFAWPYAKGLADAGRSWLRGGRT